MVEELTIKEYHIPYLEVEDIKIPRILLGTSPFIGGGQFGERTQEYYQKFVLQPKNIVEIMIHSIKLGVIGVQAIAYDFIIEAIKEAERQTEVDMVVVGTLPAEEPLAGFKRLRNLQTEIILVHGAITDTLNLNLIERFLNKIREAGSIPGVTIHNTFPTLSAVLESRLDIPVIMLPINKNGFFMKRREETLHTISNAKRFIIAKKTLAAGRIPPREGLEYVYGIKSVSSIAVGIGSKEEAEEIFKIAKEILCR